MSQAPAPRAPRQDPRIAAAHPHTRTPAHPRTTHHAPNPSAIPYQLGAGTYILAL